MLTICFDAGTEPRAGDWLLEFDVSRETPAVRTGPGGHPLVLDAHGHTGLLQLGRWNQGGVERPLWLRSEAVIEAEPVRVVLAGASDATRDAVFRGLHIALWRERFRYCSRCGSVLSPSERELARVCQSCGETFYPTISPAMIVLVTRNGGREVLLCRGKNRSLNWMSLVAGYCEAGESAEQTVAREVMEETGIRVRNIRYAGSQGWPFSQSLMLGFRAEWESGEVRPDPEELDEAGWFTAGSLPPIPPPLSIANRLITAWVEERRAAGDC